jgi:hypothetical protein
MKSYHADPGAGLSGLTLRKHEKPTPGPREVLLKIRANPLNSRELLVLRGTYPLPVKPDVVIGADSAGGRRRSRQAALIPNASHTHIEAFQRNRRPHRICDSRYVRKTGWRVVDIASCRE